MTLATLISEAQSHFETEPAPGTIIRVEFRAVPYADLPYEVVTVVTEDGVSCETRSGFSEYFSAKAHYGRTIARVIEVDGVRRQ